MGRQYCVLHRAHGSSFYSQCRRVEDELHCQVFQRKQYDRHLQEYVSCPLQQSEAYGNGVSLFSGTQSPIRIQRLYPGPLRHEWSQTKKTVELSRQYRKYVVIKKSKQTEIPDFEEDLEILRPA